MLSPTLSRLPGARTAANTAVEQVALLASSFEPASFPAHGQNRFEDEGALAWVSMSRCRKSLTIEKSNPSSSKGRLNAYFQSMRARTASAA